MEKTRLKSITNMVSFNFTGKTVFITGSTQGIGLALAESFVSCGAKVIVHCSTDKEKAERIKNKIHAYKSVIADLSDVSQTQSLFSQTGKVDVLILNASVQIRKNWLEITEEEFDRQVNVNYKSSLLLMQAYYPGMKKNKFGRIITIGSVQQKKPHPDMAIYASTKNAVVNLVKNVAKQVAPYGVTVNNVAPGTILTPRNDAALFDDEYKKKCLSAIPVGFFGESRDISGIVLTLASEFGRFITGEDIFIDGGTKL